MTRPAFGAKIAASDSTPPMLSSAFEAQGTVSCQSPHLRHVATHLCHFFVDPLHLTHTHAAKYRSARRPQQLLGLRRQSLARPISRDMYYL